MEVNIPENVRGYLYMFCIFGSVAMTYLGATEIVGTAELAAWSGFTAAVALMARFNLGNSPKDPQ